MKSMHAFESSPSSVGNSQARLPDHVNIDAVYRRQKFGALWSNQQDSSQMAASSGLPGNAKGAGFGRSQKTQFRLEVTCQS